MVGAGFGDEDVFGLAGAGGLHVLLEGGFGIDERLCGGVECGVEAREGRLDEMLLDELLGGFGACVEIESCGDGFERVGEKRGLAAAAGLLLTFAEEEIFSEVEAGGDFGERLAADECGAKAGELAFAGVGEETVEGLGDEEAEDGVANELECARCRCGLLRWRRTGFQRQGSDG